jgi:peptide/nickel transport system ATP-binding protein
MRAEEQIVQPLVTVQDLRTHFLLDEGTVHAVEGVSLEVPQGKTTCLVGESGCGKSVTAFSIMRLVYPPGRIVAGRIVLHRDAGEVDLTALPADGPELRAVRGGEIAMVFQEPMTSLSPVHTVGAQIVEAVQLHSAARGRDARRRALEMMGRVGTPGPPKRYAQYPHEMSGGLRQRAMIAMALSCRPRLLIADEPTTALDVTIQAQILELMRRLQAEMGMSILLITHDLGVVAEMADRVAVMYLGRIVEMADCRTVLAAPAHPYTRALLRSIPGVADRPGERLHTIAGSVPDPLERLPGCPFAPRCEEALQGLCDRDGPPPLAEVDADHLVACRRRVPAALAREQP